MTAQGISPQRSCGSPTTTASATRGWETTACSTSIEEMFSPPEMIRSFLRSTIQMKPSSSARPTSPVENQPSASNAAAVSFGLRQ
jgi:hypothetical protein